jgi:hypothetical protein
MKPWDRLTYVQRGRYVTNSLQEASSKGFARGLYLGNYLGGALMLVFGAFHLDKFPIYTLVLFAVAMTLGGLFFMLDCLDSIKKG